jgi:hypothetical protein
MRYITSRLVMLVTASTLVFLAVPTLAGASKHISPAHIGLGATYKQMSSAHGEDKNKADGCDKGQPCFGPPEWYDSVGPYYQFTNVNGFPNVSGYQQNFAKGTSAVSAVSQILEYLPKDAKEVTPITVINDSFESCGIFRITSKTVEKDLAPNNRALPPSPGANQIWVSLQTNGPGDSQIYNPHNTEFATVAANTNESEMSC